MLVASFISERDSLLYSIFANRHATNPPRKTSAILVASNNAAEMKK
jgi:hypothetical protein